MGVKCNAICVTNIVDWSYDIIAGNREGEAISHVVFSVQVKGAKKMAPRIDIPLKKTAVQQGQQVVLTAILAGIPTDLILQQRGATKNWPRRYKHLVFLNSQIQGSHPIQLKSSQIQHKKRPNGFQCVMRNIIFDEFVWKEKNFFYCLTFAMQFRFGTIYKVP